MMKNLTAFHIFLIIFVINLLLLTVQIHLEVLLWRSEHYFCFWFAFLILFNWVLLLLIIIKDFLQLKCLRILWMPLTWRGRVWHLIGILSWLKIINNILWIVIVEIDEINLVNLRVVIMLAEVLVMVMNMVLIILFVVFILILKPFSALIPRFWNFQFINILMLICVSFIWIISVYFYILLVFQF